MLIELHILSKGGGILRSHACIINIVCPVMYVHYLDHGLGSVVLSTTGGCRADKHSPTHQARHVTGKISAGAYGCDMGSAAGHKGWRNSPQLRAGYSQPGGSWLGDAMQCWHPPQLSTVGEWPLYGYLSISRSCITSGRR